MVRESDTPGNFRMEINVEASGGDESLKPACTYRVLNINWMTSIPNVRIQVYVGVITEESLCKPC